MTKKNKILFTGNINYGIAKEFYKLYPDTTFISRETDYDLTDKSVQEKVATECLNYDIFVNNSALYRFEQTNLLQCVFKKSKEHKHNLYIINIGSTIDRFNKGTDWIYSAEKKALRDFSDSLSKQSVWTNAPRVTLISFGSLSNVRHKHPDRTCLPISVTAKYIKWLLKQPKELHIHEISIDPVQN